MSRISEQIMATSAHHHLFCDNSTVALPSLTTIYANLVVPLSSSDKDEAKSIPQKHDHRVYTEKSLCLIDGHDDNGDDDDNNDDDDGNDDHEHGDGSTEFGGGDVTVEYEGSELEDRNGLVQCSSAASRTLNYIHRMEESSESAQGSKNMDHMGIEKVWSNEKHNSYIDSMEADFVRDMYAHDYCSLELCRNQPQSESESEAEAEASMVYTGTSSDIMDKLEGEAAAAALAALAAAEAAIVVCSPTIMDEMLLLHNAQSPSTSCWRTSAKEKRSSLATTTSSKAKLTENCRRFTPGTSNWQNIVQYCLRERDIARLHEHAAILTNPIQDSNPAIDSNVKKRACQVVSCEEERSIKTLKLAGKKHPFLSSYNDQVVPSPCINSTGSHQDSQVMQGLAKITRAPRT